MMFPEETFLGRTFASQPGSGQVDQRRMSPRFSRWQVTTPRTNASPIFQIAHAAVTILTKRSFLLSPKSQEPDVCDHKRDQRPQVAECARPFHPVETIPDGPAFQIRRFVGGANFDVIAVAACEVKQPGNQRAPGTVLGSQPAPPRRSWWTANPCSSVR